MKPDLTTRRGIDAQIMNLRRQISKLPEDAIGEICLLSENIQQLKEQREALAKPWEKPRPTNEASLSGYGVTV